ncbi:MAG: sulfurtransferase TusA family protein [Candidatus Helarchaeota archaeon]
MGFYKLPSNLNDELVEYEKLVKDYLKGLVHKTKMKAIRVPMGVYEQRDNEKYMVRIRLPGGDITPKQLIKTAEIAKKYTNQPLHFTTRQDVQIHSLNLIDTINVMNELKQIGLSSRGGGGNTVRNILGSFDAGIDPDEVFNISPYIRSLTSRLIAESDSWTLPRKLKIAFSINDKDTGLATINDLGFIAKKDKNGRKGFSVYIAGGMGRKPKVGTLLYDFIDHTEVYNTAKATKNLFDKFGNRKNKYKARLRFLYNQLGHDAFIQKFENELKAVQKENYPPLDLHDDAPLHKGHLEIPLFLGDLTFEKAIRLGRIIEKYGEDTIRITPNQNILLRNIPENTIEQLRQKIKKEDIAEELSPLMANAVACAGASTCKLGICLSRNLLTAIKKKLTDNSIPYENLKDLLIKISGCPNTCGHHIIADIGFSGAVRRHNNRPVPYYNVVIGGIIKEGKTKLAERVTILPAKAIPDFFYEFLNFVHETRKNGEPFTDYLSRIGKNELLRLSEKYSQVPTFKENSDYYHDWYDDKVFSLTSKIEGECSAGLFDLIELDFSIAEKGLEKIKNVVNVQEKINILYEVIGSTSRALLITKGLEPKSDIEAVVLFKEHFIGKHIDKKFGELINKYLFHQFVQIESVKELYQEAKKLYNSMDNSLRFPEIKDETENKQFIQNKIIKDFRGVACPLNFVKTKLVLETMNPGDQLEILLDDGEPIDNVPASVKAEGHKILNQKKIKDYWSIVIKKC